MPLVEQLLKKTAATTVRNTGLDPPLVTLYQRLVLATGWQESCWRQYVVRQKKIVPLRSNTGDIGLMQLNEKVWRGFYDVEKLRWDIAYNIEAGTEVLLNYLVSYALKKGEHKQRGGLDNLWSRLTRQIAFIHVQLPKLTEQMFYSLRRVNL